MSTWLQKQTPLLKGVVSLVVIFGAGLVLNSLGALIAGAFLDVSRLMNLLFCAFSGGSVTYWVAKHPSGVADSLTPSEHGLLTLAVLWSETLLAMLIVWATGLAEGDLSLLIELTALMATACALLAAFACGAAYRAQARQRDEHNPEIGNAPSG